MTYQPPPTIPIPAQRPGPDHQPAVTRPTRHLSAAAYLDDAFCEIALHKVHGEPKRVVAPSYGFDLVTVLGHCQRAWRMNLVRDGVIAGALLVALCAAPVAFFASIALLIQFYLLVGMWRLLRDLVNRIRSGSEIGLRMVIARALLLIFAYTISSVVVVYLAVALTAMSLLDSGSEPEFLGAGTVFLLLVIFGVPVGFAVWKQIQLDLLAPGHPVTRPAMSRRMQEIDSQQSSKVVAFSGYRPFVGSGIEMNQWGTALRLIRKDPNPANPSNEADREFTHAPFSAKEINTYVLERLRTLTVPSQAGLSIPGMSAEDRVFIAATEVSHFDTAMTQDAVDEVISNPVSPTRHFLAFQVDSWHGELITQVYAHLALQGRTLYLELSSWVLPPCEDRFRIIDFEEGTGAAAHFKALWRGLVETPRVVARAPRNLIRALFNAVIRASSDAVRGRGIDYGARLSVRELAMSDSWRSSLLEHDFEKYSRIIERRIVAAVYDFLEARDVDMTEFRQRAINILNKGIMHTGTGDIDNSGAVGDRASVTRPHG